MLRDSFALVRNRFSGDVAKEHVAAIVRHHRIQGSPGYRAAATYVLDELHKAGLDAQLETFPANRETRFWTESSFQEWHATAARLDLIDPADHACRLADYRQLKLSLIQRSTSFDGTAEVVLLSDGLDQAEYDGLDLAGKIVLTKGDVERVRRLAVEKHGAIGIIFYGMRTVRPVREPMDLPDARQYTSYWWSDHPSETKCFGFVLSPRQGAWLCELVRTRANEGLSPVRVRAHVSSRLYDGTFEVVTAFIPGDTGQQALLVSHLCHPQPSANDNASGAAAALETARTLHYLIRNGDLPMPRRGIRFLWVPEMLGTYAYLSAHESEIPSMVAGINLDMVGGDEVLNGSSFLLECPPDSASSFVPDLLERLREELFDDAASHTGLGTYPLFRYATTGFSGGSDHYIFSDPTVGVPMAMLIQSPDKFYHTSADTLDRIDPATLARAGSLAGAFLYFVASAGWEKTTWLAYEMAAGFQVRLAKGVQAHITRMFDGETPATTAPGIGQLRRLVAYRLARHRESLVTLSRLWTGAKPLATELSSEAAQFAEAQLERCRRAAQVGPKRGKGVDEPGQSRPEMEEWEEKAATFVPRRLFRGPVVLRGRLVALSQEEQTAWHELIDSRSRGGCTLPVMADYWADGRRTALEIVDLVEIESGIRDAELVVKRFELLHTLGLIELCPVEPDQESPSP